MAGRVSKSDKKLNTVPVEDYEHSAATRTNNPPAGLAHLDRDETPTRTLTYDPHLDPQLIWAGKAEHDHVEVPAPSIHVHEELSAQKIVGSVRRQRLQPNLFDVTELDGTQAVEFYQHEMSWSNRMILGDSLVVMNSLLERERMAGQVQCVFMDPPYGIRYQSNFQPNISSRSVVDGRDEDLTREPEMIQAYRDTWQLGVHSYLTYLRDRLSTVKELLTDSGSVFVQIGDENVHHVREILGEVFGARNFVSQITVAKTTSATSSFLPGACDFLLWYAKDKDQLKYRTIWTEADRRDSTTYRWLELPDGTRRGMTAAEIRGEIPIPEAARLYMPADLTSQTGGESTQFPVKIGGKEYRPGNRGWRTNREGMDRLIAANRIHVAKDSIRFVTYADDFPYSNLNNIWTDTGTGNFTDPKIYVVQTGTKVIERCLLMTTDPGDLVIDPTCGSGTTAYVAEQYGLRWITIDTSRVALSLARERLLTATFPYFQLRDEARDVDGGFVYEPLKRITLRSIARGEVDEPVVMINRPVVVNKKVRVTGPFTVEALSRYAINPTDDAPSSVPASGDASNHVETLLDALRSQGIPRPGKKPAKIESLSPIAVAGSIQAEGVVSLDGRATRFAVSLGPRFGAITMAQVSDSLRQAIGFGLVVFAGFAVSADVQAQLSTGKVGGTEVALLLANPDLLVGSLLKNTSSSQTFRLYASPDVSLSKDDEGYRVTVNGVDSYDASTGAITSFGKTGIQAWFLDADFDSLVFRVSQAFFPVTDGWEKLSKALRGTVDAELVEQLHSWRSLPFEMGENGKVAVRVISNDGNAAEVIILLDSAIIGKKS